MKKVLIIAYFFPPIGGSGVQRTLKYVKYMPGFGYKPIVATVKNGHNFAYDFEMLKEIPKEAKIYRSNSGEKLWLRNIIEEVDIKVKKLRNKKNPKNPKENEIDKTHKPQKEGLKTKVFRYMEYNVYIPDSKIRWKKHAIKDIKNRILKNNDIDIIYSTSSPYTDHLIGLEIKKATNKPWVADFRDPWIGNDVIIGRYDEKRKSKEKIMESEVVEYADIIINVTEPITNMYKKRYPQYKNKFVTITNGFDSEDIKDIKIVRNEKFIISYTGVLVGGSNPQSFLDAIDNIVKRNPKIKEDLVIKFTGYIDNEYMNMIGNCIARDKIIIENYVEHNKALDIMANSNINLIILPDDEESKGVFTGKIFDYMLCERPILGIMPRDGVAAKTINENEIGLAVGHNEIEKIEKYIEKMYNEFNKGNTLNSNAIEKCIHFDRKNLTKELTDIMGKL